MLKTEEVELSRMAKDLSQLAGTAWHTAEGATVLYSLEDAMRMKLQPALIPWCAKPGWRVTIFLAKWDSPVLEGLSIALDILPMCKDETPDGVIYTSHRLVTDCQQVGFCLSERDDRLKNSEWEIVFIHSFQRGNGVYDTVFTSLSSKNAKDPFAKEDGQ